MPWLHVFVVLLDFRFDSEKSKWAKYRHRINDAFSFVWDANSVNKFWHIGKVVWDILYCCIFKLCPEIEQIEIKIRSWVGICVCSGHLVGSHDRSFNRTGNWKWVCSRCCSWGDIWSCFLYWSLWIFPCSLAIWWIWDWMSPVFGQQT